MGDKDEKFVVVATEISTTVGKVDATWLRLNEYDLNNNLASRCLPPAVMTYEALGFGLAGGSMMARSWTLAAFSPCVKAAACMSVFWSVSIMLHDPLSPPPEQRL